MIHTHTSENRDGPVHILQDVNDDKTEDQKVRKGGRKEDAACRGMLLQLPLSQRDRDPVYITAKR